MSRIKRSGPSFDFSVIIAVFNTAEYLQDAVNSVIHQSYPFERIEVILVDDGSTDGSGAICDGYKNRFPENIRVVHKRNGGAASARNAGLQLAKGKYLNFLDADDKLSRDTMEEVFQFFVNHEEEIDVVAIRMVFFGAITGQDMLNNKFNEGDRVIDLLTEDEIAQMSCSSAFVNHKVIKQLRFNEELAYAEDAQWINEILLKKKKLGVVSKPTYYYRRRLGDNESAIQKKKTQRSWYFPYFEHFMRPLLDQWREADGKIIRYAQFVAAYDLRWRMLEETRIPSSVLSTNEAEDYLKTVYQIYSQLDYDVIQKDGLLKAEYFYTIFKKRNKEPPQLVQDPEGLPIWQFRDGATVYPGQLEYKLEFISDQENCIKLEGELFTPTDENAFTVGIEIGGETLNAVPTARFNDLWALNESIAKPTGFCIEIPKEKLDDEVRIAFVSKKGTRIIRNERITCGDFFPISHLYKNSYCPFGKWILHMDNAQLVFTRRTWSRQISFERRFQCELKQSDRTGAKKAVAVRLCYHLLKHFLLKPIWLISDRLLSADDNGRAFFEYLVKEDSLAKKKKLVFVLDSRAKQYEEVAQMGEVVAAQSHKHKMLYLLSQIGISSAADDFTINPLCGQKEYYKDITYNKPFVFLQHGIIKDDLSHWANRYEKNLSGFVTSAIPEYQSILEGHYGYDADKIWLTGLPRYDLLYHDEKKIILIMPTWRQNLVISNADHTWGVADNLIESEYYQFYDRLLNSERLLRYADEYHYEIWFIPHPNMRPALSLFHKAEGVHFVSKAESYKDLFAQGCLLVTDYSSVAFDFAYLEKPVIYTQFDQESFFAGEHTYEKGYFDYDKDGFGEIETELEGAVDRVIAYMKEECRLKEQYRERIRAFFAFSDQNNCKRVAGKIIELLSVEQSIQY